MLRLFIFVLCAASVHSMAIALELGTVGRRAEVALGSPLHSPLQNAAFSDTPGPFSASATGQFANPPGSITGRATQTSYLSPTHFYGSGETTATLSEPDYVDGTLQSLIAVNFTLTEPTDVRIAGTVERNVGNAIAEIWILRGSAWSWHRYAEVNSVLAFDEVLTLAPGDYEFFAYTILFARTAGSSHTAWSVDFAVLPEPATALLLIVPMVLRRWR